MPEYTLLAVGSVLVTVLLERWLRAGLFRRLQYWIAMAIVFAFQVLVDGWLTKLTAPIVVYAPDQHLGVRWPWGIPVEDFLFGFSLVTLTLIVWGRVVSGAPATPPDAGRADPPPGEDARAQQVTAPDTEAAPTRRDP